jgi:hypothetical protein
MSGKSQPHPGRRQIDECRESPLGELNLFEPPLIEAYGNASWVTRPDKLANENQNFFFVTNAFGSDFRATRGIILVAKY